MNNTRNSGGNQHKIKEKEVIEQYQKDGWRVVNLKGRSPDLIATRNGELIAIDILGILHRKRGKKSSWTYKSKKERYESLGFDRLIIETFEYEKSPDYYYKLRKQKAVEI